MLVHIISIAFCFAYTELYYCLSWDEKLLRDGWTDTYVVFSVEKKRVKLIPEAISLPVTHPRFS